MRRKPAFLHACRKHTDDQLLATVEMEQVRLWRTSDWSVVGALRRDEIGAGIVSFSNDGKLIAIADKRHVKLFDAVSLAEIAQLATPLDVSIQTMQHVGGACGLDFSPDDQMIAARSEDGSILLWDLSAIRPQLESLSLNWVD